MKIIKSIVKSLFNKFGYVIFRKRSNIEIIDKYTLAQYYKKDDYLQRYLNAIEKAGAKLHDNFSQQRRYYSIYQMVKHVIKNSISGDFSE